MCESELSCLQIISDNVSSLLSNQLSVNPLFAYLLSGIYILVTIFGVCIFVYFILGYFYKLFIMFFY